MFWRIRERHVVKNAVNWSTFDLPVDEARLDSRRTLLDIIVKFRRAAEIIKMLHFQLGFSVIYRVYWWSNFGSSHVLLVLWTLLNAMKVCQWWKDVHYSLKILLGADLFWLDSCFANLCHLWWSTEVRDEKVFGNNLWHQVFPVLVRIMTSCNVQNAILTIRSQI